MREDVAAATGKRSGSSNVAGLVALLSLSVAMVTRLLHLIALRKTPYFDVLLGDSAGYDRWARQIAGGDWLGSTVFYQTPLYPYSIGVLYAILGPDLLFLRLAQVAVGAASCALVALASCRLFGPREALATGVVTALYAPSLFYDALVQKANLDFLLVTALLLALTSTKAVATPVRTLVLGALLGLLALNRENALVLFPLFGFWIWSRSGGRGRNVLLLVAGLAIPLSPVAARNWIVGKELAITTAQLGPNLFIGNNPEANGTYRPLVRGRGSPDFERTDATRLAEKAVGRELSPSEVSAYWRDRAIRWAVNEPGPWGSLIFRKFRLAWNRVETMDTEDLDSHAQVSPTLAGTSYVLHFGTLAPIAFLGIWFTRRRWRGLWIYYAILAFYSLSLVIFFVLGRYRYPLVPVLAMFFGPGLVGALEYLRRRQWTALLPPFLILLPLSWWINSPAMPTRPMMAKTRSNLAGALAERGRLAESISYYHSSLALEPHAPRVLTSLAKALQKQGNLAEAAEAARLATVQDPLDAEAHGTLGILNALQGKGGAAVQELAKATHLEPDNPGFHFNLGTALARQGRTLEALDSFQRAVALDPLDAKAFNNLGIALAQLGRFDEAARSFGRALELDPESHETRANLSRALQLSALASQQEKK